MPSMDEQYASFKQSNSEAKAKRDKRRADKTQFTTDSLIKWMKEETAKNMLTYVSNLQKIEVGQISNFIKECNREERDIKGMMCSIIEHWRSIHEYLCFLDEKNFHMYFGIERTVFNFGLFYKYRGHIYDWLHYFSRVGHPHFRWQEVWCDLLSRGVAIYRTDKHCCKIPRRDPIDLDPVAGEETVVLKTKGGVLVNDHT